jgi:hypothetical protein
VSPSPLSSVATLPLAVNGPSIAPDASGTRQGPAIDHFHIHLLWHPLQPRYRKATLATAVDFDAIVDAYYRRLRRYEQAGDEVVRIFTLRTELEGALVVYADVVHWVWADRCTLDEPEACRHRAEGWYDNWPHEPIRPLGDPA